MKTRVRAVVIKDGKLLTIKRVLPDRTFWVFPGGGMEESDSTAEEALVRECLEEVNIKVKPKKLIWNRNFKGQEELFYIAEVVSGSLDKGAGPEYDDGGNYVGTHEPQWTSLTELDKVVLYPENLKLLIQENYANSKKQKTTTNWENIDWSPLSRQEG